jgi:hypothetical protein
MKTSRLFALTLALLLAPALLAQSVDELLDQAAQVEYRNASAWLEIRSQILAQGEDALPALRQAAAEGNWTREGWVRAMAADAVRVRIESQEEAEQVDYPIGINPERYRLFRRPIPLCKHDLRRMGKPMVPVMLERWYWLLETTPFSTGEAGDAERNALARALLFVPGSVEDARGRFAVESAMNDRELPDGWRQVAAVSVGQLWGREGVAMLTKIVDDATQPLEVREGAAWALGYTSNSDALDVFTRRLADENLLSGIDGERMFLALVCGVGHLCNSWGWRARGIMRQAEGDRIRQGSARLLIELLKSHPEHGDYIADQLALAAWEPSVNWLEDVIRDAEGDVRAAAEAALPKLTEAVERLNR